MRRSMLISVRNADNSLSARKRDRYLVHIKCGFSGKTKRRDEMRGTRHTLATVLLGLAALAASVIPAWRAAGVEPMAALRAE